MDYNAFAEKIKLKYPDYQGIDNRVLAEKIIAKYPDYKDSVEFGKSTINRSGQSLTGTAPSAPKTAGGFASNLVGNTVDFIKGGINMIKHPIQTAKGLEEAAYSGIAKMADPMQYASNAQMPPEQQIANQVIKPYRSLKNYGQYAYEKPLNAAMDASMALGGVGAGAKVLGMPKTAAVALKASEMVNPISMGLKATGKGVSLIGKGATKVSAPFRGSVNPEILKAAQETGIKLPASAISKSPVVQSTEALAGRGLFGNKLVRTVEQASDDLITYADDVVKKTGKIPDATLAGKAIVDGLEKYRQKWFDLKGRLYEKAKMPDTATFTPTRTKPFIDDILEKKRAVESVVGSTSDSSIFSNLQKRLSGTGITPYDIKATIQDLSSKVRSSTDPVITGSRAELSKLATLMSQDLDDAIKIADPTLYRNISRANKVYKTGLDSLNSRWGKTIDRLKDQPDLIVDSIISSKTSISDIPEIYKVIGKENIPQVQSAFMGKLLQTSISPLTGEFFPSRLATNIAKYGDTKLGAILTTEQLNAIKNIKELSAGLGRGQKIATGSQTAFLLRLGGEVATAFTHPLLALKVALGDAGFSAFVGSKAGQKFLTTGFSSGVKVGEGITKAGQGISKLGKYETLGLK